MVAGEPSGDLLAARIIQGLHHALPDVVCQGIGGPAMQAKAFDAWFPMHALSVFGYVDALKALPRLMHTYLSVRQRWATDKPAVFVGIDAPDFNLRLEHYLKARGVPTVHFVGPSIWAWRYERIHRIREAVSHMLVLFPFEEAMYQKEGVPVTYVGHPLAELIPEQPQRLLSRELLGLDPDCRVLALLPGSRSSEVRLLAPRFLQAAQLLQQQDPDLRIVVPMVNSERRHEFEQLLAQYPLRHCMIIGADTTQALHRTHKASPLDHSIHARRDGAQHINVHESALLERAQWPAAWRAMEACDALLVASGTATLEAALFKRPMVISYVLSPMMRRIMAWKSGQERPYVPWVGLPNVLSRDFVVPELLQDEATPQALAESTWTALTDPVHRDRVTSQFERIHRDLSRDTPGLAAQAILKEIQNAGQFVL